MSENNQPSPDAIPFGIVIQYVKDQSFENPNPVDAFLSAAQNEPSISMEVGVSGTKIRDEFYEITLNIRAEAVVDEQKKLFIAELSYAAIVGLGTEEIPQDAMGHLIMVHFPTLMFPFARNIIANMTRDGGFPALMLTPVDFYALYEEQQKSVH
jgi:preprotein translocase subunit SecB